MVHPETGGPSPRPATSLAGGVRASSSVGNLNTPQTSNKERGPTVNTTPKPSQIVLMASGAVTFVFSFLAFYKLDFGFGSGSKSYNAWSGDAGTLFMATWPALFGLIIGGLVAATVFGNVSLPDRILTFSWKQIYFVLAFTGFIIMLGYLLGGGAGDGIDKGFGFYIMLLGSIGLLAGSVMELLDGDTAASNAGPGTSGGAPNPF